MPLEALRRPVAARSKRPRATSPFRRRHRCNGRRAAGIAIALLSSLLAGALLAAPPTVGAEPPGEGGAAAGRAAAEAASARVRARVAEATDPGTSERRREELAVVLAEEEATSLTKPLREALLPPPRRVHAIALGVRLRVPGVFSAAKKYAEGPFGAGVADLSLTDPDPAASAWLVARWCTNPPGSREFDEADAALRRHPAQVAVLDRIAAALGDAARGEFALSVLRFQLAVDDETPPALAARWDEARAQFLHESAGRSIPGRDLRESPGWRLRGARAVGGNLRIPAGSCVDLPELPRRIETDDCALRLAVAASGEGTAVVVATAEGAQQLRVRFDGTVWFLVEGPPREGDRVAVPGAVGAWTAFEFRIRDARVPDEPLAREVRVLVDGKELRPSGGFWRLASPPRSLSVVAAPGGAPTLAGGFRWGACPR